MPFGVQGPQQRPPRLGILLAGQMPGEDFPVAIVPDAQGGQHDPCFLAFHRALTPEASACTSPVGTASFSHNPSTKTMGGGVGQPRRFESVGPLFTPQHQAMTGGKREDLAHGQLHGFLQVAQTVPERVVQQLLIQKGPPTAFVPRDALPLRDAVAAAQLGHTQSNDTPILRP